jgi:peptidyl-dipeptidase Dcp
VKAIMIRGAATPSNQKRFFRSCLLASVNILSARPFSVPVKSNTRVLFPLFGSVSSQVGSSTIFGLTTSGVASAPAQAKSFVSTTCLAQSASTETMCKSDGTNADAAAATTNGDGCSNNNPLLTSWTEQPFLMPPFHVIAPSHYEPAFQVTMEAHLQDLHDIVNNEETPTFDNVIVVYDRAGRDMGRVEDVFYNMCSSLNTPDLQEVETAMSPILSRHGSAVYTLPGLFEKINSVYEQVQADKDKYTPQQVRLVERIHLDFKREGAHFSTEDKAEYAEIKVKLATLSTQFAQNVLKDEETTDIPLYEESDMDGCPDSLKDSAREAAKERGDGGNTTDDKQTVFVITLSRSMAEPFLTTANRRELRQQVFDKFTQRGELSEERNNLPLATEILRLRKSQAELHGYASFAEYQTMDTMAKNPKNVMNLLEEVWHKAKEAANRDRAALEELAASMGDDLGSEGLQPWDWRYYAEKYREKYYNLDESELRPYFSLEKMTEAAFYVSNQLYGLKYTPRPKDGSSLYHEDVDFYEVHDKNDKLVSIFLHDNYARKFKSSGAWMSEYRTQTKNLPSDADQVEAIPIVSNNNNFAKGSPSTLLSFDDAVTLFHEFGHAHHGMLSDANYETLASTNVLGDFVELPSQLMEHWLSTPEVLKKFARHYETDEPIPDALLEKLFRAQKFDQAFQSIEYTSCALMDMSLHQLESDKLDDPNFDLGAFEKEELERLGMPKGIVMRHRPAHFLHLFAGSDYASGYYFYLWAEVLDADAFAAFKETGNVFDPSTAEKVRKYIYSAGNTVAPDELFRQFRGRDPDIKFMLEKKGLA